MNVIRSYRIAGVGVKESCSLRCRRKPVLFLGPHRRFVAALDLVGVEGILGAQGHGFGLPGPEPLTVRTPWAGLRLAQSDARALRG